MFDAWIVIRTCDQVLIVAFVFRCHASDISGAGFGDHFKAFNDSHGHAAGDAALRREATTLRAELRRSDVVARYGGEEILVAMPGTQLRAAMEKLDEVRVKIGLTDIPLPRGGTARVTVSMGVATLPMDGPRLDILLDAADTRMYAAKEAGRNRVFGPADVPATPPPGS